MAHIHLTTEVPEDLLTEASEYLIIEAADMSERYVILTTIIAALEGITVAGGYSTDVAYVSETLKLKHPEELDKNKFPACFPIDADEVKEQMTIGDEYNLLATLGVVITSMVFDPHGRTAEARSELIRDVERAMVNNVALNALLLMPPQPTKVETDKGFFGNYSVFSQEFELQYVYNHATGG